MPTAQRRRTSKATAPPAEPAPDATPNEPAAAPEAPAPAILPADIDVSPPDQQLSAVQAIAEVMRRIGAIGKDRTNDEQGFRFRGVDDLMNAAHPAMAAVGLVCLPHKVKKIRTSHRATRSGGTMYEIRVLVQFRFYGSDGSFVTAEAWGEGVDSGDKGTSKAHTMAYKTCIYESFHVPTAEASQRDPDGKIVEDSKPVRFPGALERVGTAVHSVPEANREAFKTWWQAQHFPGDYADWSQEQVEAVEAAVAEYVTTAERQAAEAAQAAAEQSQAAPEGDATQEPTEAAQPAAEQPPAAAPEPEPDPALQQATEAAQDTLGAQPVDEPTHPQYAQDDVGVWLRRVKQVGGTPRAAVALSRIWRDGANRFAEAEVEDSGGTKMPLWKLVVAMGYPPAGEGRE